jgi:hypothetical protein
MPEAGKAVDRKKHCLEDKFAQILGLNVAVVARPFENFRVRAPPVPASHLPPHPIGPNTGVQKAGLITPNTKQCLEPNLK